MVKILITGFSGMLGKDIVNVFAEDKGYDLYGFSRKNNPLIKNIKQITVDLTDSSSLIESLQQLNPDIIIHCAANVNVDDCEKNKEYTCKLHVETTKALVSCTCLRKFIYISSDSVFDGLSGNYTEHDKVNPLNYYGKTKVEGENMCLVANSNTLVIRSNIYGFHIPSGNSLVEWAVANLSQGKSIEGFEDVFFNPLYTKQLAVIIKELIKIDYNGILHVGCSEYISKYNFLVEMAKVFKLPVDLIHRGFSTDINFIASRPRNTTLDISKSKLLLTEIPSLASGLMELKTDYNRYDRSGHNQI